MAPMCSSLAKTCEARYRCRRASSMHVAGMPLQIWSQSVAAYVPHRVLCYLLAIVLLLPAATAGKGPLSERPLSAGCLATLLPAGYKGASDLYIDANIQLALAAAKRVRQAGLGQGHKAAVRQLPCLPACRSPALLPAPSYRAPAYSPALPPACLPAHQPACPSA